MRKTLWIPIACAAFAMLISSCAPLARPSAPTIPPRRSMPATATQPCTLVGRLPVDPAQADLEIGYAVRGAEILACDAKRGLAVDVHRAEHDDEDAWLKAIIPARPLWRRILRLGR